MTWSVGQKLQDGNYTIESILARGNFTITYLARNALDQNVVIKTVNDIAQQRPDFDKFQQDFLNDALRLSRCNHRHIVRVVELIQEGALYCMVMEYIEGENLANTVTQGISQELALRYIEQIGDGLVAVHLQGLLHQNVKPQNIILRGSSPVLIDLAIGEFSSDLNEKNHPEENLYAPIELYEQQIRPGAYTDVYGLAATLYAILTGELPVAARLRAANTPLIPPQDLNSDISDEVNIAILKGMALQPQQRPQSVQEWLELLFNDSSNFTAASQQSPPKKLPIRDFPWLVLAGLFLAYVWIGIALAKIFAPAWVWVLVLACALIPQWAGYAYALFGLVSAAVMAVVLVVNPSSKVLSNLPPIFVTAVSLSETAVWYSVLAIIFCAGSNSVLQKLNEYFSKFRAFLILGVTSWLGIGLGRLLSFIIR